MWVLFKGGRPIVANAQVNSLINSRTARERLGKLTTSSIAKLLKSIQLWLQEREPCTDFSMKMRMGSSALNNGRGNDNCAL
jgi:hypothetical protein